jgi:hypothetical protein
MAVKKSLEIDRRVGIAMSVLTPTQREAVDRVLRSPRSFFEFSADSTRVKAIEAPGQQLYLLRVTPQLRLVYATADDGIQVLDLVERATMDRFSSRKARRKPGPAGNGGTVSLKTATANSDELAKK